MSDAPTVQIVKIDDASEGQRIDNFLIKTLKGVPKSHVYRVIRGGQVRVNKKRVQAETRLCIGDQVRIPPIRVAAPQLAADSVVPALEFPVLFEDDAFLAINKPAGIAVHGGSGQSFGVIEQLRKARPQARFLELVHRLDKETSGILLIAKKRSALNHLQDQFRSREMDKRYLALVQGIWPIRQKVIDLHLYKYLLASGERRVKVVDAAHAHAQRSLSLVKVLARQEDPTSVLGACSLVEVRIKTGRTHQIRVHLSHHRHPIAMDDKYGDEHWNRRCMQAGLSRMFLHAHRLEIHHPTTGLLLQLQAQIPAELKPWALNLPEADPNYFA